MSKRGFTLIELLVVVSVLALLASIVFSNLGGAREGARISNALSFQSQTHSLLGSDLIGRWNFNETLEDSSGFESHGSWGGGGEPPIDRWVDGVPGTHGNSLYFIKNQVITALRLEGKNSYTVSFWINEVPNDNHRSGVNMANQDGGIGRLWVVFGNRAVTLNSYFGPGKDYWHNGTFNYDYDRWIYITAIFDKFNGLQTLYINGIFHSQRDMDKDEPWNNSLVIIGGVYESDSYQRFIGKIDNVRIYSRALTASEVQTLYAQTKDNYLVQDR